jgi:hypothetical protein
MYTLTAANAEASAAAPPEAEPRFVAELIKRYSAAREPTVDASSTVTKVDAFCDPQGPSAVIMAMDLLFVPAARPGLPPEATRYTSDDDEAHV